MNRATHHQSAVGPLGRRMAEKKIIAVVGATGMQGGGLVRAIQRDTGGEFAARALTRDVRSTKARELAKVGAEVVAADVGNPESLKKAFRGAYAAYCVTFFWVTSLPKRKRLKRRRSPRRRRPPDDGT